MPTRCSTVHSSSPLWIDHLVRCSYIRIPTELYAMRQRAALTLLQWFDGSRPSRLFHPSPCAKSNWSVGKKCWKYSYSLIPLDTDPETEGLPKPCIVSGTAQLESADLQERVLWNWLRYYFSKIRFSALKRPPGSGSFPAAKGCNAHSPSIEENFNFFAFDTLCFDIGDSVLANFYGVDPGGYQSDTVLRL